MSHAVYWIRCADHTDMFSQGYIGVSKDAKKRFVQHFRRTQNAYLKHAIEKYGWDNLVKTEILISDEAYCLDIEEKLRPEPKIGWNLVAGGGRPPIAYNNKHSLGKPSWNKGKKYGPETRKKISDAVRLAMQDPARLELNRRLRLGVPSPMRGKKHTPETIEKLRLMKIGLPSKKKGKPLSKEIVDKMIATTRSQIWTCPHCNTTGHSVGAGNRWHFDNCKMKEQPCLL